MGLWGLECRTVSGTDRMPALLLSGSGERTSGPEALSSGSATDRFFSIGITT